MSTVFATVLFFAVPRSPRAEELAIETIAEGLQGPGGLAIHPVSGRLYVIEEAARRISVISAGQPIPVLAGALDSFVQNDLGAPGGSSPSGDAASDLAFDPEGRLYVVDTGRLLCFDSLDDGRRPAGVVAVPSLENPQGCTSVTMDRQGRLFVTTRNQSPQSALISGTVVMREREGRWRLVDCGPFAEFLKVAVDSEGRTLVVGERRSGDLSWYDVRRQANLCALERMEGIRRVGVLPDGTVLAAVQRADESWSLSAVDAFSGCLREWIGGLTEIGGLQVHPENGDVFLTLKEEGKLLKIRPPDSPSRGPVGGDRMSLLAQAFDEDHAVAPAEWPDFFRPFIERLGLVRAVNESPQPADPERREGVALTLPQFASHLPVVAAKLRARLVSPPTVEPDPVEEISFLLFYPNRSMMIPRETAPDLSLFWARHRSGRVARTRFLPNQAGFLRDDHARGEDMPEMLVSFPSGYYARETPASEQDAVNVYFLGLGLGPDYWIDVRRKDTEKSRMVVEQPDGRRADYLLEPYPESPASGGWSVLVAGMKPLPLGWLDLGAESAAGSIVSARGWQLNTRHSMNVSRPVPVTSSTERALAPAAPPASTPLATELARRIVQRAATQWAAEAF